MFSEKFSMNVLLGFVYDQIPSAQVGAFMNTDSGRILAPDVPVLEVAQRFLDTFYRRLPVVEDGKLLGQISRRDVLRAEHHLTGVIKNPGARLQDALTGIEVCDASREFLHGPMGSGEVGAFMDTEAGTIEPETDLLEIAQIFRSTDYRRLPVIDGGKLVGQVSRRDVLQAAHALLATAPRPEQALLYLTALSTRASGLGF